MKKQLLLGAALLGSLFTVKAQDSCETAVATTGGVITIAEMNGEYVQNCFAEWGEDDTADAAEWYMVTATENGAYRVNTNLAQNAGGDTRIAVYSGTCGELTCWWSADDVWYGSATDPNNNYLTDFQFPVEEGETYYITFDNQWSPDGFDAEITFLPADCDNGNEFDEDWSNESTWYFCWSKIDSNADDNGWAFVQQYNFDDVYNIDAVAAVFSPAAGTNDDWLISKALNATGGTEYTFRVLYNGANTTVPANESFEVAILTIDGDEINVEETIGTETGIVMTGTALNQLKANATEGTYTFTPAADGVYHLGLLSTSAAGGGALLVFEIGVEGGVMGTNNAIASQFSIYPNPASNVINVANAENILVNGITITDLNGRTVKSVKYNNVTEAQVNISDLASGMYMMTVSSDKGAVTKKIVKQ